MTRKIIHIDLDAFYPSVEQRDHPKLRGKPVIVGGDPRSRGVVASASYEARKFGVHSAMSCAQAHRLCPQAHFVYPDFEKYKEASRQMREIFYSFTPLVEPLSLDEAYLDVTSNLINEPFAKNIAIAIRQKIFTELRLTASAGVGPNKWIAKLASDFKKPNGLVVIPPEKVSQFIQKLPVEKFWGVGPVTAQKLHSMNIRTAADIQSHTILSLEKALGSFGPFLFELAHGRDDREVDPRLDPKSRGSETTFEKDVRNQSVLLKTLEAQAEQVSLDLKNLGRPGRTITVKIKYSDFTLMTRSQTLFHPTDNPVLIAEIASELLFRNTEVESRAVRLVGVSVSNLIEDHVPLQLWFDFEKIEMVKTNL